MNNPSNIDLIRERIDSRVLAQQLCTKHRDTFELVTCLRASFEELGLLRFGTGKVAGGRPEKFALLNEDQCHLLLTYSGNTAKVHALKVKLVKAFCDARRVADIREGDYIPYYHALHDAIKSRANGSPNERFMHINANKLLNQLAGVKPGHRFAAGPLQQSMLAVGCAMAAKAVTDAPDGHGLQQRIKAALAPLEGVLVREGYQ